MYERGAVSAMAVSFSARRRAWRREHSAAGGSFARRIVSGSREADEPRDRRNPVGIHDEEHVIARGCEVPVGRSLDGQLSLTGRLSLAEQRVLPLSVFCNDGSTWNYGGRIPERARQASSDCP